VIRRLVPALLLCALALPEARAEDPWDQLAAASAKPPAEAATALEELLRHNPGFHAARFNLGTLLLATDPAKAAEQLTLACGAADADLASDAAHNLALARWKQGRLEDALAAAEDAAKRNPAHAGLRDELRRVAVARADEARRKAEEEARKLALSASTLPPARVGESYRAAVPLRGGTAPYHVAVAQPLPPPPAAGTTVTIDPPAGAPAAPTPTSTPLPAGLTLDEAGVLSGTPTAAGAYQIPVTVRDAASGMAKGTLALTVLPQPAITTTTLPEAIIGLPYTATLVAVGLGTPQWSATGLPAGLTLGTDGVIRGTPTALGTAQVVCTAMEPVTPPQAPHQATRTLPLAVTDAFAPDAPPVAATVGAAYEQRLGVRGPAQAYRWSGGAGLLTVEADGRIHGTPETEGALTQPATIHAADGRSREFSLSVPVNPRPLITASEPLHVSAGSSADVEIPHSGGTAPFTWSVVEGALPTGTRLDADGHLRGAAHDPGSFEVTLQLADRWQARTQAKVTLQVDPANKPDPKDDKKQDDKQQEDKKDGKQQDTADQSKPGGDQSQGGKPQGDDQKPSNDAQAGDDKKSDGEKQAGKSGGEQGKEGDKDSAKDGQAGQQAAQQTAEQQAAALNQMAAGRWLDQLPAEDRGVLRYQLLDGGDRKPEKQGKSW
jgi:hypothetical protein